MVEENACLAYQCVDQTLRLRLPSDAGECADVVAECCGVARARRVDLGARCVCRPSGEFWDKRFCGGVLELGDVQVLCAVLAHFRFPDDEGVVIQGGWCQVRAAHGHPGGVQIGIGGRLRVDLEVAEAHGGQMWVGIQMVARTVRDVLLSPSGLVDRGIAGHADGEARVRAGGGVGDRQRASSSGEREACLQIVAGVDGEQGLRFYVVGEVGPKGEVRFAQFTGGLRDAPLLIGTGLNEEARIAECGCSDPCAGHTA